MVPDPKIGPIDVNEIPTKAISGKIGVKPVAIVNHRKMVGWKAELLVEYNDGTRDFGTIRSLFHSVFPKETEEYLRKHNLIQDNAINKWMKIGYREDPRKKSKSCMHDYDDWCELPEFKKLIKEVFAKYAKKTNKK
jgi:hypothetical protein